MLILILLLLMPINQLIAQEVGNPTKILSPKVSIFSTIYGITDFSSSNLPLITVGLDWSVGKQIYYYGKLQIGYRFGDFKNAPESFTSPVNLQLNPLGIGGYIFDTRNQETLKGWSMVMNFSIGLFAYFGPQEGFGEWSTDQGWSDLKKVFYGIGAFTFFSPELSLYARYHINQFSAIQLGLNIAAYIGSQKQTFLLWL